MQWIELQSIYSGLYPVVENKHDIVQRAMQGAVVAERPISISGRYNNNVNNVDVKYFQITNGWELSRLNPLIAIICAARQTALVGPIINFRE
jgi:hypothetical protein